MMAGRGHSWLSTWRQPGPSPDAGFISSWWGVLGQYSDPMDMEVGDCRRRLNGTVSVESSWRRVRAQGAVAAMSFLLWFSR